MWQVRPNLRGLQFQGHGIYHSEDFQLEMTSDEAVLALLDLAISEAIDFIYTVSKSFNINIKAVYPAMAKYFEGFETYCDEGHPLWEN